MATALIQPPELRSEANYPALNSWLRKAWEINRQLVLAVQDLEGATAALAGQVGLISFAAAAPTTGAHDIGEKVFNSAPAVGQPKGWVCTVSGTPGTWVSEGNL